MLLAPRLRIGIELVAEAGEAGPRPGPEKLLVKFPREENPVVFLRLRGLTNIGVARVLGDVAHLSAKGSGRAVSWVPF